MTRIRMGVDIGGSGIKAALVDVDAGELVSDPSEVPTPSPATPAACATIVGEFAAVLAPGGTIGCTVPGVVRHGVVHSAANIDDRWIGTDAAALFSDATDRPVVVLNDADAAGVAEARFGAARDRAGTVAVLTFGTGIGSALFRDGILVPNTELGHLEFHGDDAERWISGRLRNELDWDEWSRRLDAYLRHVAFTIGLDLVVVGGGVSADWDEFADRIDAGIPVVPATLRNRAGMVGAALAADTGWTA